MAFLLAATKRSHPRRLAFARRRLAVSAAALVALAGVVTSAAPSGAKGAAFVPAPCGLTTATPHYRHVVWVVLENVGYGVVGDPSAPYLNSLANECGLATNYHATTHPSLPNYVAMTTGSAQGIVDDAEPIYHPLSVPSIFSQLHNDWRAYAESMPGACDRVTSGTYAARHNPAVYFVNIRGECARNDVALPSHPDFSRAFTFVAPNVCNDMHSCSVATGDAWLAHFIPEVLASPQYRARSLALFVTFDESDASATNQVPTIVVSPSTRTHTRSSAYFTHYSLLRTTEQLLHVSALAGAKRARSMLTAFHL